MAFLSIVIPIYNVEKYLRRCLDSLIIQECFEDTDIILVDDGSTDSSGEICDEYSGNYCNIKVFHKNNGGLSDARNVGIRSASSSYIAFLDSDDLLEKGYITDVKNVVDQYNPDIIRVKCAYEKKENKYKLSGKKTINTISNTDMLMELVKGQIGNQVCFNIYRSNLFEHIIFPVGKAYEDISTTYKLIIKAKSIVEIDYTYYIYNLVNGNSITKISSFKNISDMYYAINEQCKALDVFFDENSLDKVYLKYYVLDKYIYIFFKLWREVKTSDERNCLMREVKSYILKHYFVNIIKYRYYNVKKYVYFGLVYSWRKI